MDYWIWALAAGLWMFVIFGMAHRKASLLLLDQTNVP